MIVKKSVSFGMCCTSETLEILDWLDYPGVHKPVKCLSHSVGMITWARRKHDVSMASIYCNSPWDLKDSFLQLVARNELKLKSSNTLCLAGFQR